ncbi:MAG: ATP-binding cassette domain-containing protein [Desulfurococcaceae archaeon]|uniref:ATP-binding cassette domain-containing protein n=1 Tax=Staphylothermus marinus TaxID=2280 RepID=A0A7C4D6Z4_STAMA
MNLLEIVDLSVAVNDRVIVKNVNLAINESELHVIMGPNGSGKSTLLSAIMGLPRFKITSGRVLFKNIDITDKPVYERARMGIALAHQNPPEIRGVKFRDIASYILKKYGCSDCIPLSKILDVEKLFDRDLFLGFSGGEKKRSELYLVLLQGPRIALLDEPDSGVDIESIESIARAIEFMRRRGTSVILVTHSGVITSKLSNISRVHILIDGEIKYSGYPDEVLPVIMKFGYKKGLDLLKKGVV